MVDDGEMHLPRSSASMSRSEALMHKRLRFIRNEHVMEPIPESCAAVIINNSPCSSPALSSRVSFFYQVILNKLNIY